MNKKNLFNGRLSKDMHTYVEYNHRIFKSDIYARNKNQD